ncbi:MAG TPA: D-tyrosyl-tRNA(Tyr) deacylase [Methylococcaceae bacterium]|jgi:D-tyrosyl-tRNA(Tyr) deacylase|nr:D-tyrosyl-tRNA(Tyr) deacylase [Methylococcaceae bacterium]HIN68932.1 D-tyrosyl-tRNA(Tyr) deacylase [Methylococcales bacterium]HIA44343.1 D-tyrosyl-tRNA(Tyr) deacylase [Methylococcaceae bacterium]HIB61939.1 D-tyrosyl-tRNA(Tyr) deacylase [Methylococcaceae bacterium]HIO13164.1 D-tyrosyl-tRNA(Tyr) deacylase [Methylococcales bacterium]
MITIIQRVSSATVTVNHAPISQINQGILALVAIEKQDDETHAERLLQRLLNYRIFSDSNDRMNLSLKQINGGLLLVPQFTLAADTDCGNRPSFTPAASPEHGKKMFNYLATTAKQLYPTVETGLFGANMQVSLTNDGPVTFTLRTK